MKRVFLLSLLLPLLFAKSASATSLKAFDNKSYTYNLTPQKYEHDREVLRQKKAIEKAKADELAEIKRQAEAEAVRVALEAKIQAKAIAAEKARMDALWALHPAGNNYYPGQCTWYVASKRTVPINLGNADTWYARATAWGFPTGLEPRAGAVGQRGMHVVYVEGLNPDGTINISDMNGRYIPYEIAYKTISPIGWRFIY